MTISITKPDEIVEQLSAALGLDLRKVRRILIDLQDGQLMRMFIEMHGSEGALKVDWSDLAGSIVITTGITEQEGESTP